MSESTVKKNLLLQDSNNNTPVKILVSRDINSWMETHDKNSKHSQDSNQYHRQKKFNIHKRLPPKSSGSNKGGEEQNEKQTPNFQELKKRKNDLMKTITTKKWMKQSMEDTKPGTTKQNGSSCQAKKPFQWFKRLPLIHVNQFITQEYQHKIFEKNTLIPQPKPFFLNCSTMATRKSSLKKIDRKSKQSSPYCHYQESKKRNNSSEVNQIIKQKLCKNNYTGLLASLSRKKSNGITTMQQQKNKIRVV